MKAALRFLGALLLFAVLPFVVLLPLLVLLASDLAWLLFGRKKAPSAGANPASRGRAASVVIPNWNGRDLLEKYLPSVLAAMAGNPGNEVIVVDNGSSDGSAEFVRERFPEVRLLALPENLGFGGGSNAGFRAAVNDIVVLLNSDMRVAEDFLPPLLAPFEDPDVFAVSCQIFFSDPNKLREETGLTQAWWKDGMLRVRHRDDGAIRDAYPCFYPGGGSSAFDRNKFLELGGFDELLKPFYLEDTDLGYQAWKRGWHVLYQPKSRVWHEHRGTIGKKFSQSFIDSILKKNFLLWTWKNVHEPQRLLEHFFFAWGSAAVSLFAGDSPERTSLQGFLKAIAQLPEALRSRWRAWTLAVVSDTEAFRRPMGGYYRDRFLMPGAPSGRGGEPLRVLMISPYAIEPPVHGGAVFMSQTARELARHCELHMIVLVDTPRQVAEHADLASLCASFETIVHMRSDDATTGSIRPHAVREYSNRDLEWLIHRQILHQQIDVVQIEYANMGQYAGAFDRILTCVFEHDVYFQSVGRQLAQPGPPMRKASAFVEYLRALRWELQMLRGVHRVQVCTQENEDYLVSCDRALAPKIDTGLRAGITADHYEFVPQGREIDTLLFLGSFRHRPNLEALQWFVAEVMPLILRERPDVRLVAVGSDPPTAHQLPTLQGAIELRGFVEDIREPLSRCGVFVCPILSGSGVRVKLLEAFACGIPVVSTKIGAERLARVDNKFCRLANEPEQFARAVLELLPAGDPAMVERARSEVARHWDMPRMTVRLVESYRKGLEKNRDA